MKTNGNGKKLIDTNPYLKKSRDRLKMFIRDTITSSRIEGIYCNGLQQTARRSSTRNHKAR